MVTGVRWPKLLAALVMVMMSDGIKFEINRPNSFSDFVKTNLSRRIIIIIRIRNHTRSIVFHTMCGTLITRVHWSCRQDQ